MSPGPNTSWSRPVDSTGSSAMSSVLTKRTPMAGRTVVGLEGHKGESVLCEAAAHSHSQSGVAGRLLLHRFGQLQVERGSVSRQPQIFCDLTLAGQLVGLIGL